MPGSKIPILNINEIKKIKPDIIIILPWNLGKEIKTYLKSVVNWKCEIINSNEI